MTTITGDNLWTSRSAHYWDPLHSVYRDETGTWQVFGYADVRRLLTDPETFSADQVPEIVDRTTTNPVLRGSWTAEGARHQRLRESMAPAFRNTAMPDLQSQLDRTLVQLLDQVEGHRIELVSQLAMPFSNMAVCRLLGIPTEYAEQMQRWRDGVYTDLSTLSLDTPHPEMEAELHELVELYRTDPQPGLLGDMLAAQRASADPLPDWEVIGSLAMLLWASVGTTAGQLADALLFLTEYRWWDRVRDHPTMIPTAVEELVRWYPVYPATLRFAVNDTVLHGARIERGDRVTGWITAANRDPERFPHPNTFDPQRAYNPHLGFGGGRHYCLGVHLGRLEMAILIRHASSRWPNLRLDHDRPVRRRIGIEDSLDEAHFTIDG